jgi:hypothetical protein
MANTILLLVNQGLFEILGTEAGVGDVDTSWPALVSDENLRDNVVDTLFNGLRLSPGEYVVIKAKRKPLLYGAEDDALYEESGKAFAAYSELRRRDVHDGILRYVPNSDRNLDKFVRLLDKRAEKILSNLFRRMAEKRLDIAGLICTTPLMDRVCEQMRQRGTSYVRINPTISEEWQSEKYEQLVENQIGSEHQANLPKWWNRISARFRRSL